MMRGGFMLAWSLLTPVTSDIIPKHLQERAFAGIEFTTGVGNTIAPIAAGVAYEIDNRLPFLIAAILLPVLSVGALVIERRVVNPEKARRSGAAASAERMANASS
jgi:MFS family permease